MLFNDKDLKTQNNKIYQIYDLSNILQDTRALGNEGQIPMINYILDLTLGIFYICNNMTGIRPRAKS